ncbi:hypothetical protein GCM10027259_23430 [Micromonospora palomenae]|uniref:hypothetical protein n=1 Tax=Micromonospora palomenae TaxID=1461247 RepID=UPI0012B78203|nr:hypothetical protein [Micromonospora palomenae]
MNTERNPEPHWSTRPGALTGFLGGLAAAAGAIVIMVNYQTPGYEVGFFIGSVLIVGGLLLRIESAIRSTGHRPSTRDSGDG